MQFAEFVGHSGVLSSYAVDEYDVGPQARQQFVIDIGVVSHVAYVALPVMFAHLFVGDVFGPRYAPYGVRRIQRVEEGDVCRGEAYGPLHGCCDRYAVEPFGRKFVPARDEELGPDAVAPLPRVADFDDGGRSFGRVYRIALRMTGNICLFTGEADGRSLCTAAEQKCCRPYGRQHSDFRRLSHRGTKLALFSACPLRVALKMQLSDGICSGLRAGV